SHCLMDRLDRATNLADESEIPEENEIPGRRRCSPALLLFGWTCARDGLAHAAGLALRSGRARGRGVSSTFAKYSPFSISSGVAIRLNTATLFPMPVGPSVVTRIHRG